MKRPNIQKKYIGQCIYCPKPATTKEHIVPIAFGGYHVLLDATCDDCQGITAKRETFLCEHNFNALRFNRGYFGRSRGKRTADLKIREGEHAPIRKLPFDKAPGVSLFPVLPPPGLLLGNPPSDRVSVLQWHLIDASGDGAHRTRELKASGMKGALALANIDLFGFMRVLAKIAHGYAVFEVGLAGFRPLLQPIILGNSNDVPYYVGGTFQNGPIPILIKEPTLARPYQVIPFETPIGSEKYIGAQIRLFATERPLTPVYTVIFGHPLT
jgi:hypothetical protein